MKSVSRVRIGPRYQLEAARHFLVIPLLQQDGLQQSRAEPTSTGNASPLLPAWRHRVHPLRNPDPAPRRLFKDGRTTGRLERVEGGGDDNHRSI